MGTAKRVILTISACLGWVATLGILLASLIATEIIQSNSFFFSRLFALIALVSSVITLGLWYEKARARNVIPIEEAWKLGAAYGANYARMARMARKKAAPHVTDWDSFWNTPVNSGVQQDTPPIKWPPYA